MTLEHLAIARDWAVMILAAQAIVIAAGVLFLALQSYRAMRRARPKAAHGLHIARHAVIRASGGAQRRVLLVARPLVWVNSVGAGIQAGWVAWRRGRTPSVRNFIRRR